MQVIMCLCLCRVDANLCHDMSELFTCLRHIRAAMEGEAAYYFEQDLYYCADPEELAARNVALILSDSRSVITMAAGNIALILSMSRVFFLYTNFLLLHIKF